MNEQQSNSSEDRQKILILLLSGLAAGDSLGSTSEFYEPVEIPALYKLYCAEGWPFRQVGGGKFRWNAGAPTDDTDMAVCMIRSYQKLKRFDGDDVARQFVTWMKSGPRDIGNTTHQVLSSIRHGTAWHDAGRSLWLADPDAQANGSLMRNGIVPGLCNTLEQSFRTTILHGLITHYAPLCQLCCAAHTWLIWKLLSAEALPGVDWVNSFQQEFSKWLTAEEDQYVRRWRQDVQAELDTAWTTLHAGDWNPDSFNPFTIDFRSRAGYVLLTLQIAFWAVQWSLRSNAKFSPPTHMPGEVFNRDSAWVLAWVAMIGADSDTYGAVAGPLIAAAHGGLPVELTENLHALRQLA